MEQARLEALKSLATISQAGRGVKSAKDAKRPFSPDPRLPTNGRRGSGEASGAQMAVSPRSPVRIRSTSSTGSTKILPSPILPLLAA